MRGRVFTSCDEVIAAADDSLRAWPAKFWEEGVEKLAQRYKKCIELYGEYVERAKKKVDDVSDDY